SIRPSRSGRLGRSSLGGPRSPTAASSTWPSARAGVIEMPEEEGQKAYQILRIEDLPMHDDVRKEFEQRSQEMKEGADVRPADGGFTDRSKPLSKYCAKCGASHSEPFGNYKIASRLNAHGVQIEIYPDGGIIIYLEGDVSVSTRTSRGLGTSGQLGY